MATRTLPGPQLESRPLEWDAAQGIPGGIVAGIVAGMVLLLLLVVGSLSQGRDVWLTLKGSATPFLHQRAARPGYDGGAVLLGLACHFGISIAWGAAFGALIYGLNKAATVVAGVIWGFVVWLGMYYVVLPMVGLGAMARAQPAFQAMLGHLVFGVVLALAFLPFQVSKKPPLAELDDREPIKNS